MIPAFHVARRSVAAIPSWRRRSRTTQAAEVHREARSYIQGKLKPGVKLWDICCDLEDHIRHIITENGPLAGMGFPTGCSLNHVAAHYTPNPGDDTVLQYGDVMKSTSARR